MGQRQRVKLKLRNGATITRQGFTNILYFQCCDTITYAVSARGAMSYRDTVVLSHKHRCLGNDDA